MVLKNAAVRFGRRALAPSVSRTTLRQLSTTSTTTDASSGESAQQWSAPAPPVPGQKVIPLSKKKQKLLQDNIMSLGVDSSHEHRSAAWTTTHGLGRAGEELSVSKQFAEFQRIQKNTRSLGSRVEKRYVPTELISNPPGPEDVSLELLMASQTHMGHNTSSWNPANSRYIYGVRDGIHIISLETTSAHLRRAARVVEEVSYRGGIVLFVGTRKGQMEIVTRAAELAGACHLFTKWTPGGITNRDVILQGKGLKVVDHLDTRLVEFDEYSKTSRPLMPDLVVCLNPMENYVLLYECGLKDIPTIGVIDTDADPTWVTYTIPANDDSLRSTGVIAGVLGRAGQAGQKRRRADAVKGTVPWSTSPDLTRHMSKEIKTIIGKRKEVMGKMQNNVEGFNEEEQKLLQSKFGTTELEVSEDDMVAMLGEAASEAGTQPAKAISVGDIEAQLKVVEELKADIEAAIASKKATKKAATKPAKKSAKNPAKKATGASPLGEVESQLQSIKAKAEAIEEALKGSKQQ